MPEKRAAEYELTRRTDEESGTTQLVMVPAGSRGRCGCGSRGCSVCLGVCLTLFVLATIGLAVALGIVLGWALPAPQCGANLAPLADGHAGLRSQSDDADGPDMQDELKASIFDPLTAEEIDGVVAWLMDQDDLDLTDPDGTTLAINYITGIELFPISKTQALQHLDDDGEVPDRFARVFVTMGGLSTPEAREYKVGPVNDDDTGDDAAPNNMTLVRTIPYNSRRADFVEYGLLDMHVIMPAAEKLKPLMQESFGATYDYDNCDWDNNGCLSWTDTAPRGNSTGDRKTWVWFMREVPGRFEHAVELSLRIQHEGADPATWSVIAVVYNYQQYDSVQELMDAYNAGTVDKLVAIESQEAVDSSSMQRRDDADDRPLEDLPVPQQFSARGPRFVVTGNHVNYLGWSFQISSRPSAGMQLWDIRFKGERIVYELSVQEAFAAYGGWSAFQAASVYMDSYWGMGTSTWSLIPGVDCPADAVYLDNLVYLPGLDDSNYIRLPNAVCVFEHNFNTPLRRHYDNDGNGGFNFVGGAPSVGLVVRVCSAVYNYDYVYDFLFYPNGVIESKVAISGYIQGAPFSDSQTALAQFGDQTQQFAMGNLHDHLVCYKVDLDIAGIQNSFQTSLVRTKTFTDVPGFPYAYPMRYVDRTIVQNETASAITAMQPGYYMVVNTDKTNSWNVSRGYQITMPGSQINQLPDAAIMNANSWSKYQLTVTKYHDEEAYATLPWDQNIPQQPLLDFDSYLNGEELVQEDLVAWATVGLQHLPSAEDVPTTTTAGYSASLLLRPHNFFDADPSMDLQNAVYIELDDDGEGSVVTWYAPPAPRCTPSFPRFEYDGHTDSKLPKQQF